MARSPLRPRRRYAPAPPQPLEARAVPAIFVVTSGANDGSGSFREAIQLANANPDFDEIHFNIPGSGVIQPQGLGLETITNPVLIDGYTQPGSRPSSRTEPADAEIRVTLDGSLLSSPSNGLTATSPNVTVRGLSIVNFPGAGISFDNTWYAEIVGNFIGVAADGMTAGPNGGSGVAITGSAVIENALQARIVGNLISGNDLHGIELHQGTIYAQVSGNWIGTNRAGNSPLGNRLSGVVLDRVKSAQLLDNVISGNGDSGIAIIGGATGNTIQRNKIGDGVPNGGDGIAIGQGASSNLIGGTDPKLGNIIKSNARSGVRIDAGSGSIGNRILGNAIGDNGALGIEITPIIGPNVGDLPVLTTVYTEGRAGTLFEGTLPNTQQGVFYRVEFYGKDQSNGSNTFFGSTTVAGQAGSTDFSANFLGSLSATALATATYTDEAGGTTSEFSEPLENVYLDPLIVTNTHDDGIGSLRYAIESANKIGGYDMITFNIPWNASSSNPLVIAPHTPLPAVLDGTLIDATTQPGYSQSPYAGTGVIISISGAEIRSPADGLVLGYEASVYGLSIIGFDGAGLRFQGDGARAGQMLLGISPDGDAVPNGAGAIVTGKSAGISRSTISGNRAEGVLIQGAGATLTENRIGVNFDGKTLRLNGTSGVSIQADRAQIGYRDDGNVIATANGDGVRIFGGSGNTIAGNSFIGGASPGIRLDPGANGNQVAPRIMAATPDRIYGYLAAAPNTRYWIQFYRPTVESPGGPQVLARFGQFEIMTGADGFANFDTLDTSSLDLQSGQQIMATATEIQTGNTSAFSNAQEIAAPFLVTNANDGGTGSLRWAMENANFIPGFDRIVFAIPGAGPHTISLASPLPAITDPVEIDGSSQPGFAGTPIVALDGSRVDPAAFGAANGFVVDSGGSTIRSLAIGNFRGYGVALRGNGGSRILGSFIGTDAGGLQRRPNLLGGVSINDSASNLIEGNLISGNGTGSGGSGVDVRGAAAVNNGIRGNTIGLARDGETALGNGNFGVFVGLGAGRTLIDSNAISGNGTAPWGAGVYLTGRDEAGRPLPSAPGEHQVINNRIGTNAAGTRGATGSAYGVVIDDLPHNFVSNNTISGHAVAGMLISNGRARGNVVTFNRIGTDATARYAIPNGAADSGRNGGDGVVLADAAENRIGGNGQGNIIAGNARYGIYLSGSGSESNQVGLNLFGRGADGARIPNGGGDIARLKSTPSGPRIVLDRAPIPPRVPVPRPQPPRRPPAVQPPRTLREGQLPAGRPSGRS